MKRPKRWLRACCWPPAIAGAILIGSGFAIGPALSEAANESQHEAIAETVRSIRSRVAFHRGDASIRTSSTGWPVAINPVWFPGNSLPTHPLTRNPMQVEVVEEDPAHVAPLQKAFDPSDGNAKAVWYNRTNGSVCVRVPHGQDRESTLSQFNHANGLTLPSVEHRR